MDSDQLYQQRRSQQRDVRTNKNWSCVPRGTRKGYYTGSGLSYAELGATHHPRRPGNTRSIPKLQICAPSDSNDPEAQLREALDEDCQWHCIGKKENQI